jgi:hypothetical protein
MSADEGGEYLNPGEGMDDSNVELLLKRSVKGSTMVKYSRLRDKWIFFAALHGVDVMPPDMRGLEIFLADTAMLSESAGVAAAAAVAHFCALEGYISPFSAPRFSKILRGIRLEYSKPVKPKKPFLRKHIIAFMEFAWFGSILDWRAALPMALCFQQLLRGVEAFDLNGSNVVRNAGFFDVMVESSKNHITGFSFKVLINYNCPNCVGVFLADYIVKMGVKIGDKLSFFACKVASIRGVLKADLAVSVSASAMRSSCKKLIASTGLDARDSFVQEGRGLGSIGGRPFTGPGPRSWSLGKRFDGREIRGWIPCSL